MITIKNQNVSVVGHPIDYELENGVLLHQTEWNGECYTVAENGVEVSYSPVFRFQEEGIDIDALEENSPEWDVAMQIVGFDFFC